MIIAVDFDGTVVEHKFPEIGEEMTSAIDTLKILQDNGHKIVIWTCRAGAFICRMLEWMSKRGFFPDAVNCNVVDTSTFAMPKIYADLYIDDRNFGGFPGWDTIYQELKDLDGSDTDYRPTWAKSRGDKHGQDK